MKKNVIKIWIFLLTSMCVACQESDYLMYDEQGKVQMESGEEIVCNFFMKDEILYQRDTIFLPVEIIGDTASYDRKVMFRQVQEYETEYVYDERGYVIDTLVKEIGNQAVEGIDYLAFSETGLAREMVVPAGMVKGEIPVILLRTVELQERDRRLRLEVIPTEDLGVGELTKLARTIVLSERLTKPESWDEIATLFYWGKYSMKKHGFMNQVVGFNLEDEWFKKINMDSAERDFWEMEFKRRLSLFNSDPANLETGLAPMKDENGEEITFPL